jgi:aspartyl-tRNA(Asn)/glutamyl-tRNA(Gln) amidotransferase subunit A
VSVDFAYLGLAEAAELIRDKKLSPVEYATALLARIERHDLQLNTFIALMPERALAAAQAAEAEITADRWRGLFHGLPYAIKDIIDVEGIATTAHSRVLANKQRPLSCRGHRAARGRWRGLAWQTLDS